MVTDYLVHDVRTEENAMLWTPQAWHRVLLSHLLRPTSGNSLDICAGYCIVFAAKCDDSRDEHEIFNAIRGDELFESLDKQLIAEKNFLYFLESLFADNACASVSAEIAYEAARLLVSKCCLTENGQ